jgi:hypothetical protein
LAGVLFGEAGGRTTGAYCGRVHSFLAAAVQQLYRSDGNRLAERPAGAQPPPTNVAASIAQSSTPPRADEVSQSMTGAKPPDYWENPRAATQVEPSQSPQPSFDTTVNDGSTDNSASGADPRASTAEIAEPASVYAAIPHARNEPQPPGRDLALVAAIDSPSQAPNRAAFSGSMSPPTSAVATVTGLASVKPSIAEPAAGVETGSFTWQLFAGETLIAQIKTVLAGIGVAAILIHGTRAVARTTTSGTKTSAKRGKK